MNVADIPKLYTALAEWLSCVVFVLAMKKDGKQEELLEFWQYFFRHFV